MPHHLRNLSIINQYRVCWFLTRGEAPADPKLAAATLNVAGSYQARSRVLSALLGWFPVVLATSLIVFALPGALDGQVEKVILLAFIVLGLIVNVLFNPWTRPRNVVKSMEASRRIIDSVR